MNRETQKEPVLFMTYLRHINSITTASYVRLRDVLIASPLHECYDEYPGRAQFSRLILNFGEDYRSSFVRSMSKPQKSFSHLSKYEVDTTILFIALHMAAYGEDKMAAQRTIVWIFSDEGFAHSPSFGLVTVYRHLISTSLGGLSEIWIEPSLAAFEASGFWRILESNDSLQPFNELYSLLALLICEHIYSDQSTSASDAHGNRFVSIFPVPPDGALGSAHAFASWIHELRSVNPHLRWSMLNPIDYSDVVHHLRVVPHTMSWTQLIHEYLSEIQASDGPPAATSLGLALTLLMASVWNSDHETFSHALTIAGQRIERTAFMSHIFPCCFEVNAFRPHYANYITQFIKNNRHKLLDLVHGRGGSDERLFCAQLLLWAARFTPDDDPMFYLYRILDRDDIRSNGCLARKPFSFFVR